MSATPPVAMWITRWTTPLVVLAPSEVTSATPPVAEWTTTTMPPLRGASTSRFALATSSNARRRTTAAAPATPLCFATGAAGPAAHDKGFDQQPAGATWNTPSQFAHPRISQRARPPQPRPVTLAASARSTSSAPPLSRPRTPATKPTPAEPPTPPEPLRSGAFTMQ